MDPMIDKDIQQRICNAADNLEQDYVRTLEQLVRIPSVVGNEADAQRFMAELYRSFGLDVVVFEAQINKISNHPAFIDTGASYENRPNVIGILSGDRNSHSIILNGHVDVVSPEPIDGWSRNPWSGHVENSMLCGRGGG